MEKIKRDAPSVGPVRFTIFWVISMLVTSILSNMLSSSLLYLFRDSVSTSQFVNVFLLTSSLSLLTGAFAQARLVERQLRQSMRGWMLYTIAGLVTTWVLYMGFQSEQGLDLIQRLAASFNETTILSFSLFLGAFISSFPALAFQGLWLWRRVKNAWLWPTMGLILGLTASAATQFILINFASQELSTLLPRVQLPITFASWMIMGLTMYFLITHPKDSEKAKHHQAALAESDIERVERLQETQDSAFSPDSDDLSDRSRLRS